MLCSAYINYKHALLPLVSGASVVWSEISGPCMCSSVHAVVVSSQFLFFHFFFSFRLNALWLWHSRHPLAACTVYTALKKGIFKIPAVIQKPDIQTLPRPPLALSRVGFSWKSSKRKCRGDFLTDGLNHLNGPLRAGKATFCGKPIAASCISSLILSVACLTTLWERNPHSD